MFCRHNHATLRSKSKGIFQRHILAFKTIILGSIFYATKIIVCVEPLKKMSKTLTSGSIVVEPSL